MPFSLMYFLLTIGSCIEEKGIEITLPIETQKTGW